MTVATYLHHLAARAEADAMQLARCYADTWQAAAAEEPRAQCRHNAGRKAANAMLRDVRS